MPCISLDTLKGLPRVWPLCAGFQELTHGSAVTGGMQGEKNTGKAQWVEEERKGLEEYFKYFIF